MYNIPSMLVAGVFTALYLAVAYLAYYFGKTAGREEVLKGRPRRDPKTGRYISRK